MTTLSRLMNVSPAVVSQATIQHRAHPHGIELEEPAQRYIDDIPWALARAAFSGTSHWPDHHARQAIIDYAQALAADYASLLKLADTDDLREEFNRRFAQYRQGYQIRTMAFLSTRKSTVSVAIYAPRDRPEPAKVALSVAATVKANELENYRALATEAIRRDIKPQGKAGPAHTIDQVSARIAQLEAWHQKMKTVNAAIRDHLGDRPAQVAKLIGLGIEEDQAHQLCIPDYAGRCGFSEQKVKNNGSEILRLRKRLASLQSKNATP